MFLSWFGILNSFGQWTSVKMQFHTKKNWNETFTTWNHGLYFYLLKKSVQTGEEPHQDILCRTPVLHNMRRFSSILRALLWEVVKGPKESILMVKKRFEPFELHVKTLVTIFTNLLLCFIWNKKMNISRIQTSLKRVKIKEIAQTDHWRCKSQVEQVQVLPSNKIWQDFSSTKMLLVVKHFSNIS